MIGKGFFLFNICIFDVNKNVICKQITKEEEGR